MRFDITTRPIKIKLHQRRVVRTRASDQHVVHRRWQLIKKLFEELKVSSIESCRAHGANFVRGTSKTLRISPSENHLGPFGVCPSRSFKSDATTTANDQDGLAQEFWFSLTDRGGRYGIHGSSDVASLK